MASQSAGTDPVARQKRSAGAGPVLRLVGRSAAAALAILVVTMVSIQFARVFARDVREANELSSINMQIAELQKRRAQQQAEVRRLRDPAGVIPEIHDRLRMVRSNEVLIFVSPAPLSNR